MRRTGRNPVLMECLFSTAGPICRCCERIKRTVPLIRAKHISGAGFVAPVNKHISRPIYFRVRDIHSLPENYVPCYVIHPAAIRAAVLYYIIGAWYKVYSALRFVPFATCYMPCASAICREYSWQCNNRAGVDEAHLVIYDRDPQRSWDEKIWRRDESHAGLAITVWGA